SSLSPLPPRLPLSGRCPIHMNDVVSDGLSRVIAKLDPEFDGSDLTEITHLQQQELTLTISNLTSKDVRTLIFGKKELLVEEIGTPSSPIISKHFMVGDFITKVDGKMVDSHCYINNILTAKNKTTVVVRRRAYASVPSDTRLRNTLSEISLTRQKGFVYQIITCNNSTVRQEKRVTSSFGFLAVVLGGKFVVVKIAEHSAAEKFFSIGDSILDLNGRPLRPSQAEDIRLINPAFQKLGEISILIERPVTARARREACTQMRKYLATPNTEPVMAHDCTQIGVIAAMYHKAYWRRLTPTPITVENPGIHRASPKKRSKKGTKKTTKSEKPVDEGIDQSAASHLSTAAVSPSIPIVPRVQIDNKRNYVEIFTDVTDLKELESVGSRYGD
ncbi:hypothetical protein PFISCL1PPCAC_24204, partial [Pristionchus fissidentatus]